MLANAQDKYRYNFDTVVWNSQRAFDDDPKTSQPQYVPLFGKMGEREKKNILRIKKIKSLR